MDAQSRRRRPRGLEACAGPLSALLQGQGCPSAQAAMRRRRTTRHRAWRGPGRRPGRIGACLGPPCRTAISNMAAELSTPSTERLPPPRAPWTRGPARKRHPAPADREHRRADQACTQVPSRAARSPPAPVRHTKRRGQTMSDCPVDSHAGFQHRRSVRVMVCRRRPDQVDQPFGEHLAERGTRSSPASRIGRRRRPRWCLLGQREPE